LGEGAIIKSIRLIVLLYTFFLSAAIAILMAACSPMIPQPTEDTSYLTPIPDATRKAFNYEGQVTNKLEAAIAAMNRSMGGHFGFTQLPTVVSVEKLSVAEADKRLSEPGSPHNYTGSSQEVWFVVLEGEIQIIPPPPPPGVTATPWSPFHGCNYVLFGTDNPGGFEMGGYPCPTKNP
jgi:hypothetical protein